MELNKGGFMATIFHSNPNYFPSRTHASAKISQLAVPLGRFLYSLIFIMSGLNHFTSGSISYAANAGVPLASILVPVSGIIALIGGLSVLTGFHTRTGSLLLLLFLVPVTFIMHNFWAVPDPEMAQMQMIHFMKNLALIGGATLLAFYGAGPLSFDNYKARRKIT
jgi:putative oxidoreductase